jgi:hypothetical protein
VGDEVVDVEVDVDVDVELSVPLPLPPQAAVSELSAIAAAIAAVTVKRRDVRLPVMSVLTFSVLDAWDGRLSAFYPLGRHVKHDRGEGPDSQGVMRP